MMPPIALDDFRRQARITSSSSMALLSRFLITRTFLSLDLPHGDAAVRRRVSAVPGDRLAGAIEFV